MTAKHNPASGDYFTVEYDEMMRRYSHHRPHWRNVHEYRGTDRPFDALWFDVISRSIKDEDPRIMLEHNVPQIPELNIVVKGRGATHLRADTYFDGDLGLESVLLCGVHKRDEKAALLAFNRDAGTTRRTSVEPGWRRPYLLSERPLCATVWHLERNDSYRNIAAESSLQALAAAYFRFQWVA